MERIDRRPDLHLDEADFLQHLLPGCTRQTTGNSRCPEIDILNCRLGHRPSVCDIRELQMAARPQHPMNLPEHHPLVGAQIDHAIADDDIRPPGLDRQVFRQSFLNSTCSKPIDAAVLRAFDSISSVMSTPTTWPEDPT